MVIFFLIHQPICFVNKIVESRGIAFMVGLVAQFNYPLFDFGIHDIAPLAPQNWTCRRPISQLR
jgi:hypothetical protein